MLIALLACILQVAMGDPCACGKDLPAHYYVPGQYGHEEANDVCMAYGLLVGAANPRNRLPIADCIAKCQHEGQSRTWIAEVDGLPGDPCLYLASVHDGGRLRVQMGAVFSVGHAMCADLTAGVLCAEERLKSGFHFDNQLFYGHLNITASTNKQSHNACHGDNHLHIINTPTTHGQAEQVCHAHGYKLADYTTGTAQSISKVLKKCLSDQPKGGWLRSINGVLNRQQCVIAQVVGDVASFDSLAVSVSVTPEWCDGEFAPICQDVVT